MENKSPIRRIYFKGAKMATGRTSTYPRCPIDRVYPPFMSSPVMIGSDTCTRCRFLHSVDRLESEIQCTWHETSMTIKGAY